MFDSYQSRDIRIITEFDEGLEPRDSFRIIDTTETITIRSGLKRLLGQLHDIS